MFAGAEGSLRNDFNRDAATWNARANSAVFALRDSNAQPSFSIEANEVNGAQGGTRSRNDGPAGQKWEVRFTLGITHISSSADCGKWTLTEAPTHTPSSRPRPTSWRRRSATGCRSLRRWASVRRERLRPSAPQGSSTAFRRYCSVNLRRRGAPPQLDSVFGKLSFLSPTRVRQTGATSDLKTSMFTRLRNSLVCLLAPTVVRSKSVAMDVLDSPTHGRQGCTEFACRI